MLTAADLREMKRPELDVILASGHAIDLDVIEGRAYRGVSLNLPRFIERLTWKTFMKVFAREGGELRGFNVRIQQTGLEAPFRPKRRSNGEPVTFGPFLVLPAERGLMLDYGPRAGVLDPLRLLRDPIVAVNEGSSDLLLGTSLLELPFGRASTPSFFSLERDEPWAAVKEGA